MERYDNEELFALLRRHYGVKPDRRGECHVDCPMCGAEAKRGSVHFSFCIRGGFCFVCGQGLGLYALAKRVGLLGDEYVVPPRPRPKVPKRKHSVEVDWTEWMLHYAEHPQRVELWQAYKPVPTHLIERYHLGLGIFPPHMSRCRHERLMVPIIAGGKVVSFRGRSLGCGCGKWLSPLGFEKTLWHGERLLHGQYRHFGWAPDDMKATGRVVYILENPIDAILLEYVDPRKVALATLSVSYWSGRDDVSRLWTEALCRIRPKDVVVWYDNHRPGNGGGEEGRREWIDEHRRDIVPNGVKLANLLSRHGLFVRMRDWQDVGGGLGVDVGDLLERELSDAREGSGGLAGGLAVGGV